MALSCDVTGVTVSDTDEFVVRVLTADLSSQDVEGLARFCDSAREVG